MGWILWVTSVATFVSTMSSAYANFAVTSEGVLSPEAQLLLVPVLRPVYTSIDDYEGEHRERVDVFRAYCDANDNADPLRFADEFLASYRGWFAACERGVAGSGVAGSIVLYHAWRVRQR